MSRLRTMGNEMVVGQQSQLSDPQPPAGVVIPAAAIIGFEEKTRESRRGLRVSRLAEGYEANAELDLRICNEFALAQAELP